MECIFCKRFNREWPKRLSEATLKWERLDARDADDWKIESDQTNALIDRAESHLESEPDRAAELYREAAQQGSIIAHRVLGWLYHGGKLGGRDLDSAKEHYCAAWKEGSHMAGLSLARAYFDADEGDECIEVLEEAIESGVVSARYHYVCYKLKLDESVRVTDAALHKQLEIAAEAGHPSALEWNARLKARGCFGFLKRFSALGDFRRLVRMAKV